MRIELYGQPIVNAREKVVGSEVLFRMAGPSGGKTLSPADYLDSMYGEGMPWFMDATVMGILIVSDTSPLTGPLFINVCPETLESDSLFQAWLNGVRELSIRRGPGRLVVEIPERGDISLQALKERMHDIRYAGAQLALDDFPGGSLTSEHLSLYQWDYIKICAAECRRKSLAIGEAISMAQTACPDALIIIERLAIAKFVWADNIGASGFQSFEAGLPRPLNLKPFHSSAKSEASSMASVTHLYRASH